MSNASLKSVIEILCRLLLRVIGMPPNMKTKRIFEGTEVARFEQPKIQPRRGDVTADGGIINENGDAIYSGKELVRSSRVLRAKRFDWQKTGLSWQRVSSPGDLKKDALVEMERKR